MIDDWKTWTALQELRDAQLRLSADERKEMWSELMAGYCRYCGYEDPQNKCQCWNDE